ncbi:competence protein ComG [Bacillus clarus]|uniref:ComG operon 7 family protein n=1 Tax=Bacillus clarus TaxID=2338372 RepID=A0A090ZCV0_9BACI|nr:competence type IV pilus minor pilin ComGG [Bacillus clarus]KFN02071.1 comG operon 7 family protein [Bacillus clarus]RFT67274.1 competence protein ComG [Bacillus clarus]
MKAQNGFAMPGTLILLLLLFSFLIYETNMLLSDKKFYMEAEQKFLLEEIADQAVSDIKKDLQQKNNDDTFLFMYEHGEVSGKYMFENDVVFVVLQCVTRQKYFYTASFRYSKKYNNIFDWREGDTK